MHVLAYFKDNEFLAEIENDEIYIGMTFSYNNEKYSITNISEKHINVVLLEDYIIKHKVINLNGRYYTLDDIKNVLKEFGFELKIIKNMYNFVYCYKCKKKSFKIECNKLKIKENDMLKEIYLCKKCSM
jgi:hypothetical protein